MFFQRNASRQHWELLLPEEDAKYLHWLQPITTHYKLVHKCDCMNAPLPLNTGRIRHPALFRDLAIYKLSTDSASNTKFKAGP